MKVNNILFYISGFGYGHLTRSIALIEKIVELNPCAAVTIKCHPQHIWFAQGYLATFSKRVHLFPFSSSFKIRFDQQIWGIDKEGTLQEIVNWIERMPAVVQDELHSIHNRYDLVISDIVPEAFAIAKHLDIPSIGISNFTWYEICKDFIDPSLLEPLRIQYRLASTFFEYDLSTGDQIPTGNRIKAGLLCRPINPDKSRVYRDAYKKAGRPLLFLSIGGAIGIDNFSLCNEVDYLCTQGINLPPMPNVHFVPANALDTQNYLAACDGVITKCGWSTVAETLIAKKPLFILRSSNGWAEENAIIETLRKLKGVTEVGSPGMPSITCDVVENSNYTPDWEFSNNVSNIAAQISALLIR